MKDNAIVQFVCFETTLDSDEFILQWELHNKRISSLQEVTLQQSENKKSSFRYISQHRASGDQFQFLFKKERRAARFPEVEIKVRQQGGYSPIQMETSHEAHADESKIFTFISNAETNLDDLRKFPDYENLNIYEAYYESCKYAYILEFFVKDVHVADFVVQLKTKIPPADIGVYKECLVHA